MIIYCEGTEGRRHRRVVIMAADGRSPGGRELLAQTAEDRDLLPDLIAGQNGPEWADQEARDRYVIDLACNRCGRHENWRAERWAWVRDIITARGDLWDTPEEPDAVSLDRLAAIVASLTGTRKGPGHPEP